MSQSPILVTGAAGFIGMHVTRRLLETGRAVIGLDNLNAYYDPRLKRARLTQLAGFADFQFEKIDIADRDAVAKLFADHRFGQVVHIAGQAGVRHSLVDPHAYVDANLVGFMNVLEGCRQTDCRHLLYASSSSVYGANTRMPFRGHSRSQWANQKHRLAPIEDLPPVAVIHPSTLRPAFCAWPIYLISRSIVFSRARFGHRQPARISGLWEG